MNCRKFVGRSASILRGGSAILHKGSRRHRSFCASQEVFTASHDAVEKSTGKRRPGARWILSAGYALPTPCAALKVRAGVSRLGAAHQPLPAREVARFYLATHPRRALLITEVSRRRSTRSQVRAAWVGFVSLLGDTMAACGHTACATESK